MIFAPLESLIDVLSNFFLGHVTHFVRTGYKCCMQASKHPLKPRIALGPVAIILCTFADNGVILPLVLFVGFDRENNAHRKAIVRDTNNYLFDCSCKLI